MYKSIVKSLQAKIVLSKAFQKPFSAKKDRLPRVDCRNRYNQTRPSQGTRTEGVAKRTTQCSRSAKHHGSYRVPEAIHPKLLCNSKTNTKIDEEKSALRMDARMYQGVGYPDQHYHQQSHTATTRSGQTIPSRHRCVQLCNWRNPLPIRRRWDLVQCGVLFKVIGSSREELQHLGS